MPEVNAYRVNEGGATYAFGNPDFDFREFRSNLVARWEFKPGSSLYVVWSQDRTDEADLRQVAHEQPRCAAPGAGHQRVPREAELLVRDVGAR